MLVSNDCRRPHLPVRYTEDCQNRLEACCLGPRVYCVALRRLRMPVPLSRILCNPHLSGSCIDLVRSVSQRVELALFGGSAVCASRSPGNPFIDVVISPAHDPALDIRKGAANFSCLISRQMVDLLKLVICSTESKRNKRNSRRSMRNKKRRGIAPESACRVFWHTYPSAR